MKIFKINPFFNLLLFLSIGLVSCSTVKSEVENANTFFENQKDSTEIYTKPKLVVGIVVDQMRYDYLTRFWERYGEDGFKRLINEGYNLKNAHYNYMPTYTAPGHASIFTGTTPRYHGVIGNSFYDKTTGEKVVPVENNEVSSLGTEGSEGERSPKYLLASTFGDENRLATQFKGKTIGISLKDRGSVLPAGHAANAAYWFAGGEEGKFVSSSYYMEELPKWVEDFNASGKVDSYLKNWETLYPIETYVESGPDSTDFEGDIQGRKTFPYNLKKLKEERKSGYGVFLYTAYGNSITTDFALAALEGEELGKDEITDVLTVSYSATDYVGHKFGVNSKEAQDTYLRLDQEIAKLLKELDKKVGEGEYTVFLTADHAGVHVPAYLNSKNIPGGYFSTKELRKDLKKHVEEKYKTEDLISNISNFQVFFDYEKLKEKNIERTELEKEVYTFMMDYPKIAEVYTREMIEKGAYHDKIGEKVKNGFHPKRSGDVAYVLAPSEISYSRQGSTHGSPYTYDTHIPMLFYGKGINKGASTKEVKIVDIAPTISALLGISFPSAATGEVLYEVID